MQKVKHNPYLIPCLYKWVIDLNVRTKSIKLEENIRENLK